MILPLLALSFALLTSTGCTSFQMTLGAEKIAKGLSYEKILTGDNQTVHIVVVEPRYFELKLVQAEGAPNLQKVSDLVDKHKALIAINGGFFKSDGKAAGALKINGEWKSPPTKHRGYMAWKNSGENFESMFGRAEATDQAPTSAYDNVIGGIPLLLLDGKKLDVKEENVLNEFLINRYARTAICTDTNDFIKLVVFDGGDRKMHALGLKYGASIDELGNFLLDIGCVNALNLDGGYSSTLIRKGKMVNSYAISFWPERSVGNALLVCPRVDAF